MRFCPSGFKNGLNDACVPCVENDCSEINPVRWDFDRIDNDTWKLTPNRRILNFNQIDYDRLFKINLEGETDSTDYFKYDLKANAEN